MSEYKCETCGKDKTPSETVLDELRKATLLGVIRQLNQNTYNLTKEECIDEVRSMLASLPPTSSDDDLALTLTVEVAQLLARWVAFGKAMQKSGSDLPRHLIADSESTIATTQVVEGGAA